LLDVSTDIIWERKKALINIKEASDWASQYLNRKVTISNISYLFQYGRILKYGNNGNPLINLDSGADSEVMYHEQKS
jgi:hypothetical protein